MIRIVRRPDRAEKTGQAEPAENRISALPFGGRKKAKRKPEKPADAGLSLDGDTLTSDGAEATTPAAGPDALAERLDARQVLLDKVACMARELDTEGEFDAHFIGKVVRNASQDDGFASLYERAVAGDHPKRAERSRAKLHRQIARTIRRTANAKCCRDEAGKIVRAAEDIAYLSSYALVERHAVQTQ